MPYSFASPRELPTPLRACRSLVWAQAAYTLFVGIFVFLATVVLGGTIPFRGGTVSGGGASLLGVVYMAAALLLVWLGVALGRRAAWARAAIISTEVFLALLTVVRSFDLSVPTAINVVFFLSIVLLLASPGTHRTLGARS